MMLEDFQPFTREDLLKLSWQKPMMAQVELTRDCNQSCLFCFEACSPKSKYPILSVDQWKAIFRKLKNLGVFRLNLSGGENFLYPGFTELVEFAKAEGFIVIINTNGTFSCKTVAGLADDIIFSVHGLGNLHDQITNNPGAFSQVCKHLEEVVGVTRICVNTVLIRPNYQHMNSVFDYLDGRFGLHKYSPTLSIKAITGYNHDEYALDLTPELMNDYMKRLSLIPRKKLEMKHGLQNICVDDPSVYMNQAFPLPNCAAGKYKLVVDYDGAVYPCYFFRGPEYYCGNILREDEFEIWQEGKGFNRFREAVLQEMIPVKCNGCIKRNTCFAGCSAWTSRYNAEKGTFEHDADRRCEIGNAFVGG
jgi:radical SAM protein with 4Fe4S-binding SPASM domain